MDAFIEYMVKHKKGKKESAMIIIIILSCIAITWFLTLPLLAYSFKLPQILSTLAFALFIAVFYFAFRLIKNQNIEYEYAFTNGELDIDKIMARKKEKSFLPYLQEILKYLLVLTAAVITIFIVICQQLMPHPAILKTLFLPYTKKMVKKNPCFLTHLKECLMP